jgi:hypothetical protein
MEYLFWWMDGMFLHPSNVEATFCIWRVCDFHLGSMKLPSTKILELDKTQHKVNGYVESL